MKKVKLCTVYLNNIKKVAIADAAFLPQISILKDEAFSTHELSPLKIIRSYVEIISDMGGMG